MMAGPSNLEIFNYLMDLVENDPGQENAPESDVISELLKQADCGQQYSDDDLEDILEENILTQKIKELKDSDDETKDDLNEIMGLPQKEPTDFTKNLELVRKAIEQNRKLKDVLQKFECQLLIKKRKLTNEEENLRGQSVIKAMEVVKETDFYTSFLSPYFRDGRFPCPPNSDQIAKERSKPQLFEDPDMIPNWDCDEIKSLEDSIRDTIVNDYLKLAEESPDKKKSEILAAINFIRNRSFEQIFKKLNIKPLDWDVISARLPRPHSSRDCQALWNLYLNPQVRKKKWTKEENLSLLRVAKSFKFQNWEEIAKKLNTGRSGYQCFLQYKRCLSRKEFIWTDDELAVLKSVIKASSVSDGSINWSKVMFYFDSVSFQKLYCKWYKSMHPTGEEVQKGKFHPDEDRCIIQAITKDGIPLRQVSKLLPNRNTTQIRERYTNLLSRTGRKHGSWTPEEDYQLMELVEKYGEGQWAKIAKHMKERTRIQIRHHYNYVQDALSKDPNCDISSYRKRKMYNLKKPEIGKGYLRPKEINTSLNKDKEDAELLKYFVHQRKMLEIRQSIGPTFDKNQKEILEMCSMLGVQFPDGLQTISSNESNWPEYLYEAVKYVRRRSAELSTCPQLGSSLTLFPPNLVNTHSLKRILSRLEDGNEIYHNAQESNEYRGPIFDKALNDWMKRLYIMFSTTFLLKNKKLVLKRKKGMIN